MVLFIEGALIEGTFVVLFIEGLCGVVYRGDFVVLFIEGTLWCCL